MMTKVAKKREMRHSVSLSNRGKIFPQHPYISIIFTLLFSCLLLSSAVLVSLTPASAVSASEPPGILSDRHDLQIFLDSTFPAQMRTNHIPGATISIVKDGHVLFAKGYGKANLLRGTPVSADTTLFRIASVSKLFTWTAVMQLVEQGKLNLHTDVNHYLKTFQIPATYPQPITLAHLLTHTAGFEDSSRVDQTTNEHELEPLGAWLAVNIPARVRPPGILASYSNYGAVLAGYIVQQVSGLPFDRYIEEHIYHPLGMSHSTFRQPIPAPLSANQAEGYAYTGTSYQTTPFLYLQDAPAGAMDSTATDMARFMLAHLQDGRLGNARMLQEATAQKMHRRQFTNDPRIPGMTYGFYEQRVNNQRILMHDGDDPSFHALLLLIPLQHVGLFVAYNSDGGSQAREKLWHAFLNRYFPVPQKTTSKPLTGFAERAKLIRGSYWPTRRNYTSFAKVTALLSTMNVQPKCYGEIQLQEQQSVITAIEVEPWLFRQVNGQALIAFHVGPNGTIMLVGNALGAYTKLAWYETPTFHLVLLSFSLLLFLSALLFLLCLLVHAFRFRRVGVSHTRNVPSRIARWVVGLMSGVNIVILLLLAVFLWFVVTLDSGGILLFVQSGRTMLFILALVSVLLTVGNILCTAFVWKKGIWGRIARLHYTLVSLAALAFVWELAYWNLLQG